MPNKVSVCLIKIENIFEDDDGGGAASAAHLRTLKERDRDRGRRIPGEIVIVTYYNHLWTPDDNDSVGAEQTNSNMAEQPSVSNTRETTPLDEIQPSAPEFPKEINFFSGNPSVEVTHGIIHLYKKNERKELKEAPSNKLCLLAVPASLSCHDLVNFVAPCHSEIQHIRIVRDSCPNQFMVLIEFRVADAALEFYKTYNGAAYNSLEPDSVCHAVWVSEVEQADDNLVPLGHTELPICPVCLERMDESVDGVLTILCNHAFHANCLTKWGDSTCPVCRHVQTPEMLENSVCMECEGTDCLWICLICGHVGCGRYQGGHAAAHYRATNHAFAMQLGTSSVWDYAGDNFVHRLFQSKADGKLVAGAPTSNDEGEEKIDSMQMEFTYLLTSQLDTQRKYYEQRMERMEKEWRDFKLESDKKNEYIEKLENRAQLLTKEKQALERKLMQNAAKLKEVQKQLAEENQISKALQTNQSSWQSKYQKLEEQFQEYKVKQEAELQSVKEELRDIMFYMRAQDEIAKSELKDEIVSGSVVLPEQPPEKGASPKGNRRKKKH